jgi:hypothetical protein
MGDDEARVREAREWAARNRRRAMAAVNEVPVLLPWSGVLARAEEVAVLLTAAHLYTNGIQFELSVRGRGRGVYDLHAPAGGLPDANGHMLCFGVEGADGQTAANVPKAVASERPDEGPYLTGGGGGGSHGTAAVTYLLHPVPASGPLTIWCAWQSRGVEETRVVFDGAMLGELVEQVEVLWPADEMFRPPPRPKPSLPVGGWFEAYATRPF